VVGDAIDESEQDVRELEASVDEQGLPVHRSVVQAGLVGDVQEFSGTGR
jgi:hypothetical protein